MDPVDLIGQDPAAESIAEKFHRAEQIGIGAIPVVRSVCGFSLTNRSVGHARTDGESAIQRCMTKPRPTGLEDSTL